MKLDGLNGFGAVAQSERLRAVLETRYHAADLSHMTKRGWGRIINIASAHGLIASANRAAYWVLTPLVQKQIDDLARREKLTGDEAKRRLLAEKQPSGKFATPAEIGGLAVFLCSDAASRSGVPRSPSTVAGPRSSAATLLMCCVAFAAAAADPLPALHAQSTGTTVSGVSSGAYMAVQMHVAHSATVVGAGVIAGGPYYCAQGSVFTAFYNCMTPGWWTPLPHTTTLKAETDALSLSRQIDSVRHLENSRAWLFTGSNDHTVYRQVVEGLRDFYAGYEVQVTLVTDKPAGHAMVTEVRGNKCGSSEPPFIVDCDYDAAGVLLQALLGKLNARAEKETGRLVRFDQSPYGNDEVSMDATGFVYIPQRCEKERCRIHVAFHGCRQGASDVGEEFVRYAGYNAWADTNNLIVLYPQVIKRFSPFTWNPRGCWDWWGYTGLDYHTQSGAQIRAVKGMIDRLAGG